MHISCCTLLFSHKKRAMHTQVGFGDRVVPPQPPSPGPAGRAAMTNTLQSNSHCKGTMRHAPMCNRQLGAPPLPPPNTPHTPQPPTPPARPHRSTPACAHLRDNDVEGSVVVDKGEGGGESGGQVGERDVAAQKDMAHEHRVDLQDASQKQGANSFQHRGSTGGPAGRTSRPACCPQCKAGEEEGSNALPTRLSRGAKRSD